MSSEAHEVRRGRPPMVGRRGEILDAAVEVMAARGVEGTSMAQLAQALGLSTYALTYHFGSKEGMLVAISQHVEQHLKDEFAGLSGLGEPSVRTLVHGYWETYGAAGAKGSTRLWLEIGLLASRDPERFPGFLDSMVDGWQQMIRSWMPGHPAADEIASIAFATMLGLELLELARPGAVTSATLDGLVTMFELSVGGPAR